MRPAGAKGNAPTSKVDVIVTVTNLNEDGTATIGWRQPEVGTELTGSATDPDMVVGTPVFEWSVPKVSRPTLRNDSHWQAPAAASRNAATYTPEADDVGKYLRLKASYDDEEGGDKDAYVRSDFRVRAAVDDPENGPPTFETDAGVTRKIAENADVRDAVGNSVVASDPDKIDAGRLTYTIDPDSSDADSFSIDRATGQIRVAKELDHEAGSVGDSGADASIANALVADASTAANGIYIIAVMATDPTGASDSPEGEDRIVVVITATDVDEAPSVKGATDDYEPCTGA